MQKGIRIIIVAAAFVWAALGGTSRADDPRAPTIVIRLSDHAGAPSPALARAKAEAERIFDAAGVRMVWANSAEGPPAGGCEALNVFVTLMSRDMVRQQVSEGMSATTLGSALPSTGHAAIYVDRIKALALRKRVDWGALLGRVISHEVGHLVLPAPSHSKKGLMKDNMDADPRGPRATFTPEESWLIRALLEARARIRSERASCEN